MAIGSPPPPPPRSWWFDDRYARPFLFLSHLRFLRKVERQGEMATRCTRWEEVREAATRALRARCWITLIRWTDFVIVHSFERKLLGPLPLLRSISTLFWLDRSRTMATASTYICPCNYVMFQMRHNTSATVHHVSRVY